MQNLTFFDYQNNKYGQNTLKTPKNIALHMKTFLKRFSNVSQTFRKRFRKICQTFRKRVSNISENNSKNRYTDPENDIFYLYTYTHAHTTSERS